MGLLAGAKIGERRTGLEDARECRGVGDERELAHGRERPKSFEGVAAASQVGNDGVPRRDIGFVHILVEPYAEVGIG